MLMQDYLTRRMLSSDMSTVIDLHSHLFPVRYEKEYFHQLVHDPSYVSVVLVHRDSDTVVGVACGFRKSRWMDLWGWEEAHLMYLSTFGVHVKHRRKGAGTYLWEMWKLEVMQLVSPVVDAVDLHVQCVNDAAVNFYIRMGFTNQRRKVEHYHFEGNAHDAFKMRLALTSTGRTLLKRRPSVARVWWKKFVWCCGVCKNCGAILDDDDIVDAKIQ